MDETISPTLPIDIAKAVSGQLGGLIGYDAPPSIPVQNEDDCQRGAMKLPRYKREEPPETYRIQVQLANQFSGWSEGKTSVQVALAMNVKALPIMTYLQAQGWLSWQVLRQWFGHCTFDNDAGRGWQRALGHTGQTPQTSDGTHSWGSPALMPLL